MSQLYSSVHDSMQMIDSNTAFGGCNSCAGCLYSSTAIGWYSTRHYALGKKAPIAAWLLITKQRRRARPPRSLLPHRSLFQALSVGPFGPWFPGACGIIKVDVPASGGWRCAIYLAVSSCCVRDQSLSVGEPPRIRAARSTAGHSKEENTTFTAAVLAPRLRCMFVFPPPDRGRV